MRVCKISLECPSPLILSVIQEPLVRPIHNGMKMIDSSIFRWKLPIFYLILQSVIFAFQVLFVAI
jgi:hypothetical protein